ncbi:hypothetical protein TNCV_642691 [Trichonephila clavipes]|nr:hypothetical protein TNCV_642691 [Trichonephila clavipes]
MYHDEIPERCKLNFTGIVDDALRITGELFPKQTLKKYIRKEVEIDTDGRVLRDIYGSEIDAIDLEDLMCDTESDSDSDSFSESRLEFIPGTMDQLIQDLLESIPR